MALPVAGKVRLVLPVILLTAVSLCLGFFAENVIAVSGRIANELLDNSLYIEAVMGPEESR